MPRLWNARGLSCAALFPGFLRRDLSLSSDKSHGEKGWRGVLGEIEWRDTEGEMVWDGGRQVQHIWGGKERVGRLKWKCVCERKRFQWGFLALAGLSVMRDCSRALGPYNILFKQRFPPEQTNCTHLQPTRSSAKTLGNHKRKPLLNIEHSQKTTHIGTISFWMQSISAF